LAGHLAAGDGQSPLNRLFRVRPPAAKAVFEFFHRSRVDENRDRLRMLFQDRQCAFHINL